MSDPAYNVLAVFDCYARLVLDTTSADEEYRLDVIVVPPNSSPIVHPMSTYTADWEHLNSALYRALPMSLVTHALIFHDLS